MLPVLRQPPVILDVDIYSVNITWTAWNNETDKGDLPVVAYAIFVTIPSQDNWIEVERVEETVTSVNVGNLQPDTDYLISVAAVREGSGGTGPRSPVANFSTCKRSQLIFFYIHFEQIRFCL